MEQKDYRLAAIMYTDIAGFSRMMEHDEAGTLELLAFHNTLVTEICNRHHGTVIKTIGDAFLIDFKNTVEALQSALEIQDKLYIRNKEHADLPLLLRIGIHLGDIYFFENDALGEGINIAARLQGLSHPGCICFSQDVYNQVLNKIDFQAAKLGKVSLKNITKEIHAYEITSPNVEFDPNRDKPLPGYKPGTYLDEEAGPEGVASRTAGAIRAEKASRALSESGKETANAGPDRSYTPEGSINVIAEIRKSILADIKAAGKRLSVAEALSRYGEYGVEAAEVIAAMADQGLLLKRPGAGSQDSPEPSSPGMRETLRDEKIGAVAREIGTAVSSIVTAIERGIKDHEVRKVAGINGEKLGWKIQQKMERASIKLELKRHDEELETGKWDKDLKDSEYLKPGRETVSTTFDDYRAAIAENARKVKGGLIGNLLSYMGVNALLWYINLNIAQGFLWAPIVSVAWGIGIIANIVAAFRSGKKEKEVERLPDLNGEQLDTYKKFNRVRDSMVQHTVSTLTVPAMLWYFNLTFAGPEFLWAVFPTAFMVISWISHLVTYSLTKKRLEKKLFDSLGHKGGWSGLFRNRRMRKAATESMGAYAPIYDEAYAAKEAILGQLAQTGKDSPVDKDLAPQLEEYVEQVRLLSQSANEIGSIIDAIPMKELDKDKVELSRKREASENPALKREYGKSIEEIERQEKAYAELRDQKEVIQLRLKSSVNALKQMQLDLARLRTMPDSGGQTAIDTVKRRTDELQHYMDDMRRGYEDIKADPYAELEKLVEERERQQKLAAPEMPADPDKQ